MKQGVFYYESSQKESLDASICIIGHFGGGKSIVSGQVIKTRILYSELKNRISGKIFCVDTSMVKKQPLCLLVQSLYYSLKCHHIFILPSLNGRKIYFPLLYFFARFFSKRVYHIVTGGSLHLQIHNNMKWIKYLNAFVVNWIQFQSAADALIGLGLTNVEVLANFKKLRIIDVNEIIYNINPPFRFCTFSRISKEKGIPDAVKAIENINKKYGYEIASLDIYGEPDREYKTGFYNLLETAAASVNYKGAVPFDKSTDTLKNYFALLFPTFFKSEGFAATIIDAFSSGLPVIATDWNANAEIIENNVTGIIYKDNTKLEDSIIYAIENPNIINSMKEACVKKAHDYLPDKHIKTIIEKMKRV